MAGPASSRHRPNRRAGAQGERIGREAGRVAEEIVEHLSTMPGAEAEVALELRVGVPSGVKEDLVRTLQESARTLELGSHTFERE